MNNFLFSPDGRVSIGQFWTYLIVIVILAFWQGVLPDFLSTGMGMPYQVAGGLAMIISGCSIIFFTWTLIIVLIKRAHDIGKSGHFVWLCLIPFIGFIVFLYIAITDGEKGENKYGQDPKKPQI